MDKLERDILKMGLEKKFDEIKSIAGKTAAKDLMELLKQRITHPQATNLWNFILIGCGDNESVEKQFQIVLAVLNEMTKQEVPQKQSFDMVIRLFIELPKFNAFQLIELSEYCMDTLRLGDPKCICWKDLLPEVIILLNSMPTLMVNGFQMPGTEYRQQCVRNLCTMKWPSTILTPLAMMFKDMPITKDEQMQVLNKICDNISLLNPTELPPLAYQLFRFCTTAALVTIPIVGFNRYFQKHYYQQVFANMCSDVTDYDSIDNYSEKEMLEAQDTILYHLSKATDHCITEKDIVNFCRPLAATPRYILSPFFLSAMLTMSNINRYPDSCRLSSSVILPFLRQVLRNNEHEKEMCDQSAWCRQSFEQATAVDFESVADVLIDQSKTGMDIVTPGICSLAFAMLKDPKTGNGDNMHLLAMNFLVKFLKKRHIFGAGVVKTIADFQFADQDATQYGECLTLLSITNTYTVSEALGTIQHVLDYFLLISGDRAMRMMTFLFPLIKSSLKIRDLFIEMLRSAMYRREESTRKMGVYGFCAVLKNLRESNSASRATNSQQSGGGGNSTWLQSTQHCISGYSMMSQAVHGSAIDSPQRNFDILALEILGILRKCLNESVDIKECLYEGLLKAAEFNPKLAPHILQFLEWHCQTYFRVDNVTFEIRFDLVILSAAAAGGGGDQFIVRDHLGRLMQLISHCVRICRDHNLECETTTMDTLLAAIMEHIDEITAEKLGLGSKLDERMSRICCQYLNCVEAIMEYAIWTVNVTNQNFETILKLSKHHTDIADEFKAANAPKKGKKGGRKDVTHASGTASQAISKPVPHQPENIWGLATMERFLRILHDDVSFATSEQTATIRKNRPFNRNMLIIATAKVKQLVELPEYRQIRHSPSTLLQLTQITRIVYVRCIQRLADVCEHFDLISAQLSVECFYQCIAVAHSLYNRKFTKFLQGVENEPTATIGRLTSNVCSVLHGLLEQCIVDKIAADEEPKKISKFLLMCLEILYEYVPTETVFIDKPYNWLYEICTKHDLDGKNMVLIHKLLFGQRVRSRLALFFDGISIHAEELLGQISEEPLRKYNKLASITLETIEPCIGFMCVVMKKQIDDIEYFITKAKSFYSKLKIMGNLAGQKHSDRCVTAMQDTERKICAQLIQIANALQPLCNVNLPSGSCMDSVIRLLIQYYVCLANLTKHLIMRHSTIAVTYHGTKFDVLVRQAGRPLASAIYTLIEHIDANVLPERTAANSRRKTATSDKAKMLKETKYLPKLVMRIESFNKFVILLGKKTKTDLSAHLHMGEVRDFRIRKSALAEALSRTIADVDEHEIEGHEAEDDDDEAVNEEDANCSDTSTDASPGHETVTNVQNSRINVALSNLAIMNAKEKRKREKKSAQHEDNVHVTGDLLPEKRRRSKRNGGKND